MIPIDNSTHPGRVPTASTDKSEPAGWQALLEGYPWFEGEGKYPIPAYSEFMPPPRLGRSPYDGFDTSVYDVKDNFGWQISEMEQAYELRPGLEKIAHRVVDQLVHLGTGQHAHHLIGHGGENLKDNPYWPKELADHAGSLPNERYVVLLPLALSKTQDDKGRVRWTIFGGSEQGPERAFWKGFYTSPHQETPIKESLGFISSLLVNVYAEKISDLEQISSVGFRILPARNETDKDAFTRKDLPTWTNSFIENEDSDFNSTRYLLTFRPFGELPPIVKERYFAGSLALLPFPGSLVFWGMKPYQNLQKDLPFALQIPLQHLLNRREAPTGIRVPQTGWVYEPHPEINPDKVNLELVNDTYHRTHRWSRYHRYEDELAINPRIDKVGKTLFSIDLKFMGLYDKPMAKNCQLWNHHFELVHNGPLADRDTIDKAGEILAKGGLFGYRFFFPPMRVGKYEIFFHHILSAWYKPESQEVSLIPASPIGYITAYPHDAKGLEHPIELWPRLLRRPEYLSAIQNFISIHDHYPHQTSLNIITLLELFQARDQKLLPRSFARAALRIAKHETLDQWLSNLTEHALRPEIGLEMQRTINQIIEPEDRTQKIPPDLTYNQTANRVFETAYWNDIYALSHGNFLTKDNADVIEDTATQQHLIHHHRDLEQLGDYLIARHTDAIDKAGMTGQAVCGELPFRWSTDIEFPKFGGWERNQKGLAHERNILVIIPGRDHSQAVVLADHYDTAYMEDEYDSPSLGTGARLAAAGADDNHSATATLLQAAPIYLKLAREGRLERDIWLLHLTGEEFPSDCLGARHFSQSLVEKTLKIHSGDGQTKDLSGVRVVGVYVMDMIAHNRDNEKDIFQISPGKGGPSLDLAWNAHVANCIWNERTKEWNEQPGRRGRGRGQRSHDGATIPEIAETMPLNGEVRTIIDPESSLFNTDGQIFSDTGIPVVLFMENYDINRSGYHDTKDTLENIDLDFGAALAAIAIESAARVAAAK